jgi:Na+/H+ antiporter NhaC
MILFVFMHVLFGRDFGPMKAAQKGSVSGTTLQSDQAQLASTVRQGRARSALVPLLGLIVFHVCALWVAGDGLDKLHAGMRASTWSYWRDTISDVPSSSRILFYSSCMGTGMALLCACLWEKQSLRDTLRSLLSGAKKGLLPVKILVLAWSLKNCCNALQTGEFLASILVGSLSVVWFAPLVFIVASLTSFATGTSYGTMAILIPTAIPVAFALDGHLYGVTTMIALGAVLDGAIFGDHCSPISDTTILSSISSQCDLLQHVKTQMPYSLLVASLALGCGYLPSARGLGWIECMGLAGVAMVGLILLVRLKK